MSFIGIDLGTSSIKAVLVDDRQRIIAHAARELQVSYPQPLWSEQDPDEWVTTCIAVLGELRATAPAAFAACVSIGLSGQMHGAVLLDESDRPLRPCILWNDGRSAAECLELEAAVPRARLITGNIAMPGFTAPKLAWVRKHEPAVFRNTRRVLLPKAYLRLALTGEAIEDMSDASGTLWLDVGTRLWSGEMLAATGIDVGHMPGLVEGCMPAGRIRTDLSRSLGFDAPPFVAGGAGDNAAGAVGLGAVNAGDCFLSLGTSGVLWRTTSGYEPRTDTAVHAFCHALPGLWHQMSVHLSAAACLRWWSSITGRSETQLLAPLAEVVAAPSPVLFAPYLAGERTPHNDTRMRGSFIRLGHDSTLPDMTQAVLEGVAFAFRDGKQAMESGGAPIDTATVIGGGSRSCAWLQILANVLGMTLHQVAGGETGAAFGAARMARLAYTGEPVADVCLPPQGEKRSFAPDPAMALTYEQSYATWRCAGAFSRAIEARQ